MKRSATVNNLANARRRRRSNDNANFILPFANASSINSLDNGSKQANNNMDRSSADTHIDSVQPFQMPFVLRKS